MPRRRTSAYTALIDSLYSALRGFDHDRVSIAIEYGLVPQKRIRLDVGGDRMPRYQHFERKGKTRQKGSAYSGIDRPGQTTPSSVTDARLHRTS